jgi:GNAT superfamily N-acetyltransferase
MAYFDTRAATDGDIAAIAAIAKATGQQEDWDQAFPAYQRHVMSHGSLIVAEHGGTVAGYGATRLVGSSTDPICMLTDLFVNPAAHSTGCGRAILDALWRNEPRRMTFSSLHANALPLYTSFGLDAWWPLLYLSGDTRALPKRPGWSVEPASPPEAGALELAWTGADRTADHLMWAAAPMGACVVARLDGRPVSAGSVGSAGGPTPSYGINHLALDPAVDERVGADAVIAVLSWLDRPGHKAQVFLPGPHPAARPLLAAGWRVDDLDLYMATQPGLIDARRSVPSPDLA